MMFLINNLLATPLNLLVLLLLLLLCSLLFTKTMFSNVGPA